jgi:hypothetical protein
METQSYTGWVRCPRQRWKSVCQAATWARTWDLLLSHVGGQVTEKVVLPAGVDPNMTPKESAHA